MVGKAAVTPVIKAVIKAVTTPLAFVVGAGDVATANTSAETNRPKAFLY